MIKKVWQWICVSFALFLSSIGVIIAVLMCSRSNGTRGIDGTVKQKTQEAKNDLHAEVAEIASDTDPVSRDERIDGWTSEGYE